MTREVTLRVETDGTELRDPYGNLRRGAQATATLDRSDFGLTWNAVLESGGFLVGDEIKVIDRRPSDRRRKQRGPAAAQLAPPLGHATHQRPLRNARSGPCNSLQNIDVERLIGGAGLAPWAGTDPRSTHPFIHHRTSHVRVGCRMQVVLGLLCGAVLPRTGPAQSLSPTERAEVDAWFGGAVTHAGRRVGHRDRDHGWPSAVEREPRAGADPGVHHQGLHHRVLPRRMGGGARITTRVVGDGRLDAATGRWGELGARAGR